jgi:protein gp37
MHKTRIEWATAVWNPITGCSYTCEFCYARKFAKRLAGRYGYDKKDPFVPTWHPERLGEPFKILKPQRIFCCSMGEMFGPDVTEDLVGYIYNVMNATPQHRYIILTKQPQNIPSDLKVPDNCWIGVSVESSDHINRFIRLKTRSHQAGFEGRTILCVEPMLGPPPDGEWVVHPDWMILGAETGNRKGKVTVHERWVHDWMFQFPVSPVFMKNSLRPIVSHSFQQEYPRGLQLREGDYP